MHALHKCNEIEKTFLTFTDVVNTLNNLKRGAIVEVCFLWQQAFSLIQSLCIVNIQDKIYLQPQTKLFHTQFESSLQRMLTEIHCGANSKGQGKTTQTLTEIINIYFKSIRFLQKILIFDIFIWVIVIYFNWFFLGEGGLPFIIRFYQNDILFYILPSGTAISSLCKQYGVVLK